MNKINKKHGLGFGLNALLSDTKTINTPSLRRLPIDMLKPGKYQPRCEMKQESLTELAASIRQHGIIQPIIVRSMSSGNYEIIAGERRWRAAQLANIHEVPVVIRDLSDEQSIAISLIENIQREDLNAIDTAMCLQRLIDEFAMTHENVSLVVGKSRTTVTNLLRLLELAEEVKQLIKSGDLEMGHARALLSLDLTQQLTTAKIIIAKGLSARAVENLVKQLNQPKSIIKKSIDPNISQLQKQISDKLAARVTIQHAKNNKGKIIIQYNNLDELDGILKNINVTKTT
jgi:ParB family transcriptional regulator, chromosome partitioning protein